MTQTQKPQPAGRREVSAREALFTPLDQVTDQEHLKAIITKLLEIKQEQERVRCPDPTDLEGKIVAASQPDPERQRQGEGVLDYNADKHRPISNPTASLARELMARTMEHLAEIDNDPSALRRAKRIRRELQQQKEK